jgi:hypothetical protein
MVTGNWDSSAYSQKWGRYILRSPRPLPQESLNGTHQLLAYADDVHILGVNHTENTETLLDATEEVGLEVNPEKTKYSIC